MKNPLLVYIYKDDQDTPFLNEMLAIPNISLSLDFLQIFFENNPLIEKRKNLTQVLSFPSIPDLTNLHQILKKQFDYEWFLYLFNDEVMQHADLVNLSKMSSMESLYVGVECQIYTLVEKKAYSSFSFSLRFLHRNFDVENPKGFILRSTYPLFTTRKSVF